MTHQLLLVTQHTGKNNERLQIWEEEDRGPPRKKLRAQANDRKRTVTFTDSDLPSPKRGKGWGSHKKGQSSFDSLGQNGHNQNPTQKGPSCAFHYNQHEWTAGSKLCNLNQVQRAFQDGTDLPGNLLITRDNRVTQQLKTLWQAHGCKLAFTVAEILQSLPGENASGPPMTAWWGKPTMSRPKLQKLKFVQITDAPGPVPKQGKKITIPQSCSRSCDVENHVSFVLPQGCLKLRCGRYTGDCFGRGRAENTLQSC